MADSMALKRPARWFSKTRLRSGAIAACVGCVAGCATLPALAALGAGGTASAIASATGRGSELLFGGAAAALVLGVAAWRGRQQRLCSFDAAAGAPIACTADLRNERAAQDHVDAYRAAFGDLVAKERFEGGFRWRFRARPGLEAELRKLVEREHGCCSFMSFELTKRGDEIVWEATASERAESVLDEFFRLPERLEQETRSGHDVAVLKRGAEAAGLAFTGNRWG